MGKIIASCGHEIKFKDVEKNSVCLKALAREGVPAVRSCILCNRCLKLAKRTKVILKTEEERRAWQQGNGEGLVW